ncbi:MAG: hypothetical protein WCA07_04525 [Gloeobacterales cyanobacterium]
MDALVRPFVTGECEVEWVRALSSKEDAELVSLALTQPQEGRYFLALYCRHQALVQSLLKYGPVTMPVELVGLQATLWSQVYKELSQFDTRRERFISWLVARVARTLVKVPNELPPYLRSGEIPVPLVPFLRNAIDELSQPKRLLLVLCDVLEVPADEAITTLSLEGYILTPEDLSVQLQQARRQVLQAIPQDIYSIYFEVTS